MVSFFSPHKKKHDSYHGFNRYTDEINRYETSVAGLPNNGISRSQSLTNGAGQAALAALKMHSKVAQQQPSSQVMNQYRRSSLMTSNSNRSNSLRSYTYHPTGSYTAGQSINGNIRSNSLQKQVGNRRLSSLNSQSSYLRPNINEIDENGDNVDEGDMVITTKTTKIVDSQGRTQSITTKTIKTLPDGSNIIETTTKNISRGNSRSNSLRTSSILSSNNHNIVNLDKIEEDLHDFEYSYELDNNHFDNSSKLKLNTDSHLGSSLQENVQMFESNKQKLRNNSINSLNQTKYLNNQEITPPKPLKSILKNTSRPAFNEQGQDNDQENFQDAVESIEDTKSNHPYKDLSSKPLSDPPKFNVSSAPNSRNNATKQTAIKSAIYKQLPPKVTSPQNTNDDRFSNISTASPSSSSIKFVEKVETIPIYKEEKRVSDSDFYAAAMQAAIRKVYGDRDPNQVQQSQFQQPVSSKQQLSKTRLKQPTASPSHASNGRTLSITSNISSLLEPIRPNNKEFQEINGVSESYKYGSHHKNFAKHSLRDKESLPKQTSRKERAKEERKLLKLEEAAKQKAMKEIELADKKAAKEAKKQKKRNFFSRKKKESDIRGNEIFDESIVASNNDEVKVDQPSIVANINNISPNSQAGETTNNLGDTDLEQSSGPIQKSKFKSESSVTKENVVHPNSNGKVGQPRATDNDFYAEQESKIDGGHELSSDHEVHIQSEESFDTAGSINANDTFPIEHNVRLGLSEDEKASKMDNNDEQNPNANNCLEDTKYIIPVPSLTEIESDLNNETENNADEIRINDENGIRDVSESNPLLLTTPGVVKENSDIESKQFMANAEHTISDLSNLATKEDKSITSKEPAEINSVEVNSTNLKLIEQSSTANKSSGLAKVGEQHRMPPIHNLQTNSTESFKINVSTEHKLNEERDSSNTIVDMKGSISEAKPLITMATPKVNQSVTQTISNNKSEQQTSSLIATEFRRSDSNMRSVNNGDGMLVVNDKPTKKKTSKFKQKIYKYFINSYDKR